MNLHKSKVTRNMAIKLKKKVRIKMKMKNRDKIRIRKIPSQSIIIF